MAVTSRVSQRQPRADLENALRIFQSERRAGFRDRVVLGGLERYVQYLGENLRTAAADDRWRDLSGALARLLEGYGRLPATQREQHLCDAEALLLEALSGAPQPSIPAPLASTGAAHPTGPAVSALPRVTPKQPPSGLSLETGIADLKGIGPQRARLYGRLDLRSLRDLLFHLPTRHLAYPLPTPIADLFFRAEGSVIGTVERLEVDDLPRGLKRLRATVRDDTGTVSAVWLRHGLPRLGIRPGQRIALSGALSQTGRQVTFDNPDFEAADQTAVHTRGLVPVYALTSGLSDKELRARIHWTVSYFADQVVDPLPVAIREAEGLLPLADALRGLHFPSDQAELERARARFAFEEMFTVQVAMLGRRAAWQRGVAPRIQSSLPLLGAFREHLPFKLTDAQERVISEISADLSLTRAMTRLVQGDVGSGKTAVAAFAALQVIASGCQAALMAPTEILAEQHFRTISTLFENAAQAIALHLGRAPRVEMLTGSVGKRARSDRSRALQEGAVDILIGTQALIQEGVEFARLGLVIVDEQHRFGVKQRDYLRERAQERGVSPHLLVMTATPIPRTLALSIYGDLDQSRIDELPPGRQSVKTVVLGPDERPLAYERIRRAVAQGRQAFVICPLVEESDAIEARAAIDEFNRLAQSDLEGLRLGLLHGRLRPREKEEVMRAFRDHALDVLVSTAVVEVGVDVPNASVMLIEGAERFGLAQLHQFRGRVGRGSHASVCILLSDLDDSTANPRLRAVADSRNGFELAEHDLRLRGEGDLLGVRQSGLPTLRIARLDDAPLVESARRQAQRILEQDPQLSLPAHAALAAHIEAFSQRLGDPS